MQAVALGLATFVQEDVPTVSAAALAAAGRLSWGTAVLGCFFGIWIGDALLYLAARGLGRRLLAFAWVRRRVSAAAIERSESWFARRGAWMLVTSRFVPGMRLPTYLAAGFLRLPFGRFLLVTGLVVAAWTALIFSGARAVGSWAGAGVVRDIGPVVLLPLVGFVVMGVRWAPRAWPGIRASKWRIAFERWRRWEFWPAWLFYLPVAANYLRLAVKYRGFTVPTAANPGIPTGGFVGESKHAILRDLWEADPEATAEAWLIETHPLPSQLPAAQKPKEATADLTEEHGSIGRPTEEPCIRDIRGNRGGRFMESGPAAARMAAWEDIVARHHVEFPCILKPDVGQRGIGVKLIRTRAEAEAYLLQTGAPLIVQRYAPGPFEAGVFYYRFPDEPRGRIFAITEKIFPVVVGDGRRTIEELIRAEPRARLLAERYLARLGERRREIPARGEAVPLVHAGNHAQGCIFRDGQRWWSPELEARFDAIARALPGFHVGRFDVRFGDEDEFRRGRGFRIVELNGASAEATHIYDERRTLVSAYRTLFRQWEIVFAIGAANRARGAMSSSVADLGRRWWEARRVARNYPLAD